MILAIDASTTKTGFAFGGPHDGAPKGGVWKLPGAEDHTFPLTCARLGRSITELCRMLKIEHVAVEKPIVAMGANNAAHTMVALMKLTGGIITVAAMTGASVSEPAISTVRKHFIGQGNLRSQDAKRAVMERCRLLGWPYQDDNQADANAVWAFAMAQRYPSWAPQSTPLFGRPA